MSDLDGRVVVITGAARGLGCAYAHHLGRLGVRLVLNDVDDAVLGVVDDIVAAGGVAMPAIGSVADWSTAQYVIDLAGSTYGALDGLVANAGILHVALAVDEEPDQVRRAVEANLIGTIFVGAHALRAMTRAGRGCVVTTTSGSAAGLAGASTYAATKGGVLSLTHSWALEVAGTGVRVNAVRPRAFTRMSATRGLRPSDSPPADRVAPVVEFLLSDASAPLNGAVLGFDGSTLELRHGVRPTARAAQTTRETWTAADIAAAVFAAN